VNKTAEIRSLLIEFFYGEYFKDALRNTFCVIFPIALFLTLGYRQAAIGTGLGALVISLTDLPGNRTAKFKTAVLSVSLFFLTTFLIGLSFYSQWLTATVICLMAFVFAMMSALGIRESVVGTMCIILAVFVLGLHPGNNLYFSLMVMAGGAWYYTISLIQTAILPFRSTHQAIHECLSATASFLLTKAKFYDPTTDLQECYQETLFQHQQVFEKQEVIRNLLLTDKHAMKPTNAKGRRLLNIVNSTFSLYEQVTAIHYNYDDLLQRFAGTGVLETVIVLIEYLASDLNKLSVSYLQRSKRSILADKNFAHLLQSLETLALISDPSDKEMLHNIQLNLKQVSEYIHQVNENEDQFSSINFSAFVPTPANIKTVFSHFSFQSPTVRFSLRLAVLCLAACLISYAFPNAKYSYWVLLTVVVIAKPRFSVSWKRNIQRLGGTFAGIVLGMVLLLTIKDSSILLGLSGLFLMGFFTFNRPKYAVSVFFITPCALIALSVLQGYSNEILLERSLFTVLGCAIAFAAAYVFPIWESNTIKPVLAKLLSGTYQYLHTVMADKFLKKSIDNNPKLARKIADNSLARFSDTIQHILQEPQVKRINVQMLYEIQVISYRINAMTTALNLTSTISEIGKVQSLLQEALENIEVANKNAMSFDPGNMECSIPKGLPENKNIVETITALSLQLREVVTHC
jgi:uncharacterized membrane protein YccC